MIILPDSWKKLWGDSDWFEKIFALQGEEFRNMDGRRTLRFKLLGQSYFVKMYQGIGWPKILKSILTLRKPPVMSAHSEWMAIQVLTKIGVETMTIAAYGKRGNNPARCQSFLVTEELINTISLEDYCRDWKVAPPDPALKRALIARVAEMTRTMHEHGLNHRDYYLCHFLLDISAGKLEKKDYRKLHVYLIDLHRVQIRQKVPLRWKVKDLASLYFSAMDIGLTPMDCRRFISLYDCNRRENKKTWTKVEKKAEALNLRFKRKYEKKD